MRYVKLTRATEVRGLSRKPEDGLLRLPDAEARALIKAGDGEDVTDNFTAAANSLNPKFEELVATEEAKPEPKAAAKSKSRRAVKAKPVATVPEATELEESPADAAPAAPATN